MATDSLLQQQMDTAFNNYLLLSRILEDDMIALLDCECEAQHWRRNFIRSSAALLEGHVHGLREMCAIIFDCPAHELSKKETRILRCEESFSAAERFKRTLRIAYELLELLPAPSFGGSDWSNAQQVFSKRDLLMHPKTPVDLEIPDSLWKDIRTNSIWLMEQCLNVLRLLDEKHDA